MLETTKMNEKIQIAVSLWKQLFSAAMSQIDSNKAGYDKVFKYFDEYVKFEELIFASDSFYRDHTLHCLWVYFLEEYICRNEDFAPLLQDSIRDKWMIENLINILNDEVVLENVEYRKTYRKLTSLNDTFKYEEAGRCIAALTHDLGCPLKKIDKINKAIKRVLPYYSIHTFDDFDFRYDSIQNNFVEQFWGLLSRNLVVNFSSDANLKENDPVTKILDKAFVMISDKKGNYAYSAPKNPKDVVEMTKEEKVFFKDIFEPSVRFDSDYASFLKVQNDFEEYQHGIMSAFLLVKNLEAFQNMHYNPNAENPAETIVNFGSFCTKSNILSSITSHTNEDFRIRNIDESSILTFVDELEEFSRISRASQNREYVEEFCTSEIFMEGNLLNINFYFENDDLENLDPERAFKGRCKRFLTLFDIANLSNNLNIVLRCIGKLERNNHTFVNL